MSELFSFSLRDMSTLGLALRQCGGGVDSMEEVSQALVDCLALNLGVSQDHSSVCEWVQFWKTHLYGDLTPELQRALESQELGAGRGGVSTLTLRSNTPCLLLLSSTQRLGNGGKKAIALHPDSASASPWFILLEEAQLPRHLFLGSEITESHALSPQYNPVFQLGQDSLKAIASAGCSGGKMLDVQTLNVQTIVGLWGVLPSGSCFVTLLGLRNTLAGEMLELFRPLALNIKVAILPFDRGTVFQTTESEDLFDFKSLATGGRRQLITRLRSQVNTLTELLDISEQATLEQSDRLEQTIKVLQNTLNQLQATQAQLIHTEKMSSLGQLVSGIAHEINNSVGFIYSNLPYVNQYLQDLLQLVNDYHTAFPTATPDIQDYIHEIDLDYLKEDCPQVLASMRQGTERIHRIVQSLRNFSRLDEAEQKAVDIHQGLESTLVILQNRLEQHNIEIIRHYGELPWVECHPGQLNQVFMNLLNNAIDAIAQAQPNHPTLEITTEFTPQRKVLIAITDNGLGIPSTLQNQIFDPFFTTKPIGQGTGMGLFISYQIIVEKHQGQLIFNSKPGHGTTFSILLPVPNKTVISNQ
ncbi:HAMP domain-containing histidine kinase [Spirulina subsalsa FACHB-351]|uniref:histidine kinase n=1 Tax=Spirulina subsalsa FACHB-351 TaxID=234711 RepID=A0ABT3L2W0_9CYAN|nr:HAMP domain-containing histidine kinase [Spirulina subsalsa]MCW6035424.1 HAMP domain-containing histidine kinase [Spirulina subsalsa FACHB-351]